MAAGLSVLLLRLRTRVSPAAADAPPAESFRERWNARWPGRHAGDIVYGAAHLLLWGLEEFLFRDLLYGQVGETWPERWISVLAFAALHPVLQRLWLYAVLKGDRERFEPESWQWLWLRIPLAFWIDAGWGDLAWGALPLHYVRHYLWNFIAALANDLWPNLSLPLMSFMPPGGDLKKVPLAPAPKPPTIKDLPAEQLRKLQGAA